MRVTIPLVCALLCGCSSRVTQQEIADSTGSNRLARIDRQVRSLGDLFQNRQSYDFDSLAWRTNADGRWYDRLVISQAAFQGGSPRTRWVSEIHSLDAAKGTAIIKVAEGDVATGSASIRYIYSWREWSLLTNGEVRVVRVCADPFERYQP
jgi:hypothetical protein